MTVSPASVHPPGLTGEEAARRLARDGPNAIGEERTRSRLRELLGNLVGLFALLLWAGAALALIAGTPALSAAIVAVIVVNAIFATVQEHRAQRAVSALRRIMPARVRVRRDGASVEIAAEEVVVGDVLLLAAGDRVPADAELLESDGLRIDQSTLTGESEPVEPDGMVFAGTYVTDGTAEARVTVTGMGTRLGGIARLTQRIGRTRSPLERELDRTTKRVALIAVGIGASFFVLAGAAGMAVSDRLLFAIGVTVALVPEGLLPTVTLSLALATQRMAGRNALVRRLSAVEALGEATVICTDKTGTLTENQMTVQRIWTAAGTLEVDGLGYAPVGCFRRDGTVVDPAPIAELLRGGLLCNDAHLAERDGTVTAVGDPTEAALIVVAGKAGLRHDTEHARAPRLRELPFSSSRMRMTTVHRTGHEQVAYTKGAVEAVLPRTTAPADLRAQAQAAAAAMAHEGLRVLAIARRTLGADDPDLMDSDAVERELELLGLVGMADPPRPEVADAVRRCRRAGIRIIMITGDNGATAAAVGRRIGLVTDAVDVITGPELAALGDAELRRRLREQEVIFARIAPEQKLRLAQLLRDEGEIVAMTGDGVNDAPALKHADIGVAMGRGGTDVAKEAADLILVDDNFASVVAAIEEGRAVYDNIRRFAGYHFCSNVGELIPFLVWGISGGAVPLPLVVMQVLAIDLGTDMVPAIALGTERAEAGTMERPPRPRSERLLNRAVLARVFAWIGPIEGAAAMAGFLFAYALEGWRPWEPLADSGTLYRQATTMTLAGIVMAQVGAGMAWRTTRQSVRAIGLSSNRLLLVGIAGEIAMIALLAYTPGLDDVFHTADLGPWHWLVLCAWPPLVLGAEEGRKAIVRRRAGPPAPGRSTA